ncbi:peptide chain release factor N(5)-glutamine methyltransferase [Fulvimarina endophytica]|uniref:Release factor glutamine methyltransferase n=1 Tax=Fulvimarina endophytica TaxID=2293836 RepID=A0A371XAP2_9HYPH|nr:peptide chain release factor N(5)-glutamine methyltransferase [Fulvimarina endophytica]RFC66307.1 peptide chain release factor N(5)-glutamine methyltransferase [Fulvimarina endophytica]
MPEVASGGSTVAHLLREGAAALAAAHVATPDLDARILLAEALQIGTSVLLASRERAVDPHTRTQFNEWIDRRAAGEPVFRIVGRRDFYGHEFRLSAGTLEPRPDTETIVDVALEILRARSGEGSLRILDIGTGSGAIALAILAEVPDATAIATDISEDALQTSCLNSRLLGVEDRFVAVRTEYAAGISGPLDLLVSNPPYIPSGEIVSLSKEVQNFDPLLALDGGADGLDAYRAIAGAAPGLLAPHGAIVVEIGIGQEADVTLIFEARGFALVEARKDLAGIVRSLHFRWR